MSQIEPATIAATILNAPGWVRVGITAPSERMRGDAAYELARKIIERIGEPTEEPSNVNQLSLAL